MKRVVLVLGLAVALTVAGTLLSRSVSARQGTIESSRLGGNLGKPGETSRATSTPGALSSSTAPAKVDDRTHALPRFVQYVPFRDISAYSLDPVFNPATNALSEEMRIEWAAILAERNRTLDAMQSTFRARVEDWGTTMIKNGNSLDPTIADQLPLEPNSFRVGMITSDASRVVTIRPGDSAPLDCLAEELNSFVRRTELLVRQAFK